MLTYVSAWIVALAGPTGRVDDVTVQPEPPGITAFRDMDVHAFGGDYPFEKFRMWFVDADCSAYSLTVGIPWVSLESRRAFKDNVELEWGVLAHGIPMSFAKRFSNPEFGVPVRPALPGFALDTMAYSILVYTLVSVSVMARQTFRRRRGRCERCAYRMNDLEQCPECGRARRLRARSLT
jgi:hypothetical protein